VLAEHAAFARYSPTGHIVFERQGRLEAARFSLKSLTTTGAASPIVTGVSRGDMLDGPRFAFSRSGALVYVPATVDERDAPLHWLDARGQLERRTASGAAIRIDRRGAESTAVGVDDGRRVWAVGLGWRRDAGQSASVHQRRPERQPRVAP
jgi:hypothetical protein